MDTSRRVYYLNGALGHQIEGRNFEVETFDPPRVMDYDTDDLHYDENLKDALLTMMHIGNSQFWKLNDEPILD